MALGGSNSDLQAAFQRIDNLNEERKALGDDIKEIWQELKSNGHDTKALRKAYAIRKLEKPDRDSLSTYIDTLGLFD